MSLRFTPILGTLIYVLDRARDEVLLVHRIGREDDEQFGKWNGLGGKVEPDEDIVTSAQRELLEEASIRATNLRFRGTISWPGFGPNGEDWFGFIFLATEWEGTVASRNVEGPLHWIAKSEVLAAASHDESVRKSTEVSFYEGDRYFVPLVFDDVAAAFHGIMPYRDGRPIRWTVNRLE